MDSGWTALINILLMLALVILFWVFIGFLIRMKGEFEPSGNDQSLVDWYGDRVLHLVKSSGPLLLTILAMLVVLAVGWAVNSGLRFDSEPDRLYTVTPAVVSAGNTVTLEIPDDHVANLGVITPDGNFFYLADESEPYYSFENYNEATRLRFQVDELAGRIWVDGRKTIEKVFREPGKYQFYFAEDMETEPENTTHFFLEVNYE